MDIMIPATGNIYHDKFTDMGVRYVAHYVDCAECGQEIGMHGFGRGQTVTNRIKKWGWEKRTYQEDGCEEEKWLCPICIRGESNG